MEEGNPETETKTMDNIRTSDLDTTPPGKLGGASPRNTKKNTSVISDPDVTTPDRSGGAIPKPTKKGKVRTKTDELMDTKLPYKTNPDESSTTNKIVFNGPTNQNNLTPLSADQNNGIDLGTQSEPKNENSSNKNCPDVSKNRTKGTDKTAFTESTNQNHVIPPL